MRQFNQDCEDIFSADLIRKPVFASFGDYDSWDQCDILKEKKYDISITNMNENFLLAVIFCIIKSMIFDTIIS